MAKKSNSAGGSHGASTPATVALTKAGVAFTPHAYEHDSSNTDFGTEAADLLGLDRARVFKTLVVEADGELIVAVVPVSGQLDLKALGAAVGAKRVAMADPASASRKTGYLVGGISPIGQKARLRTVLDETALAHPSIFVSGGKRGFDIELAPADLITATDAITAPVGRPR